MAALPIWIEFMQGATAGTPAQDFANVLSLDKQAASHVVTVDTPDTAPTEPSEQGLPSAGRRDTRKGEDAAQARDSAPKSDPIRPQLISSGEEAHPSRGGFPSDPGSKRFGATGSQLNRFRTLLPPNFFLASRSC